MRALFTVLPGAGHLNPVLRLAEALRVRGHHVAVASAPSFLPAVEEHGLEVLAVGPDWLETEADRFIPGFTTSDGRAQVRAFAGLASRGTVDDLLDVARVWRADLIVRETFEWGGWIAAELLGLPHAVLSSGVGISHAVVSAIAGDVLGDVLSDHGLPPDPGLARSEQHLYLVGAPASLDPPGMPRPASHVRIRPLVLEAPGSPPADRRERPLIHATLGTVFNRQPGLLQTIAGAARGLDVDLVLAVGAGGSPQSIDAPPNVRVERHVAHAELIPRCDAVICHGGFGTLMAAASAGVPVCLLPISADQPINSAVYAASGAGINLAPAREDGQWGAIDPGRVGPEEIANAVTDLLEDRRYKDSARRLAAEIEALPPPGRAAQLLERLVNR